MKSDLELYFLNNKYEYLITVRFPFLSMFTLISWETTTNALPGNQNDVTCHGHGAFSHTLPGSKLFRKNIKYMSI